MNTNNNDHISDDFLRKMIRQTPEERPSDDFVQKVMTAIPVSQPEPETVGKTPIKWWQWGLLAAAFTGVGYMIFAFDFFGRLSGNANVTEGVDVSGYISMFHSIMILVTNGFSILGSTSMPLVILLVAGILYVADKLIRRKINLQAMVMLW